MSQPAPRLRSWHARWLLRFPSRALAAIDAGDASAFLVARLRPRFPRLRRALWALTLLALVAGTGALAFPYDALSVLGLLAMGTLEVVHAGVGLATVLHSGRAVHKDLLARLDEVKMRSDPVLGSRQRILIAQQGWAAELAYLLLHPRGQAQLRCRALGRQLDPAIPAPASRQRL